MTQTSLKTRQSESGFTLVELAIVMIIIGLLIGGILKGQELINNARVSSTVAQIKAIESGVSAFRDKYASLPGDIRNVVNRIPNCTNACATDPSVGTGGDGKLANTGDVFNPGLAGNTTSESGLSFIHLAAAGMIGGVQPGANAVGAAVSNPTIPVGGSWVMGTSDGIASGMILTSSLSSGVYVASSPDLTADLANADGQSMTPVQAANIDRKVDDGQPNTGIVRAIGNSGAGSCTDVNTEAGVYNEALGGTLCGVYAKVQ